MIGEVTARVIASIEREVAPIEVAGTEGLEGFVTVSNRGEPKVEPLREASIFGEASILGGERADGNQVDIDPTKDATEEGKHVCRVEVTGVGFDLRHVDTREGGVAHALALEPTVPESRWGAGTALFNVWETRVAGNATVLHEKWNADGSRCGWRAVEKLVE